LPAFTSGVISSVGNLACFQALAAGGKAAAVIPLTSLYPLVTIILARRILKGRLNIVQWGGIVASFAALATPLTMIPVRFGEQVAARRMRLAPASCRIFLVGQASPTIERNSQTPHIRGAFFATDRPVQSSLGHSYQMNTAPSSIRLSSSTIAAPHSGQTCSVSVIGLSITMLLTSHSLISHYSFQMPPSRDWNACPQAPTTAQEYFLVIRRCRSVRTREVA
jgi:hypothetical protein